MSDEARATWVVGDVHGHRRLLESALREAGIIDAAGDWSAGQARVWLVGDFVDRGPDGIGVLDTVMGLQEQAERAGGAVEGLLGNHEVLLLGAHLFGEQKVSGAGHSFARSWIVNGGKRADLDGLTDAHIAWLCARPAVACAREHLLLHSDTVEYLHWGDDVAEINASVAAILAGADQRRWWELWRRLTSRYAFRGSGGAAAAERLLARLGGDCIVHGHTIFADQLGLDPADIEGPHRYAGGRVLAVDAGAFAGGPCLVVRLPWPGA